MKIFFILFQISETHKIVHIYTYILGRINIWDSNNPTHNKENLVKKKKNSHQPFPAEWVLISEYFCSQNSDLVKSKMKIVRI